ncbi:hypothetical protein BJX66DRAFT_318303 [Aspergillus keveii]|uniref:Secreted protein n=1 Tax=Aspergillus keveii TaxID=714993 RepID=A0ABR4FJX7_9EURO
MTEKAPLRPLLPAIAWTTATAAVSNYAKQKRRSLACDSCRKRRTKASKIRAEEGGTHRRHSSKDC